MDSIICVEKSPKMEVESVNPTEKPMDFETGNSANIVVNDQVPSTSMETTEYGKNSYFIQNSFNLLLK